MTSNLLELLINSNRHRIDTDELGLVVFKSYQIWKKEKPGNEFTAFVREWYPDFPLGRNRKWYQKDWRYNRIMNLRRKGQNEAELSVAQATSKHEKASVAESHTADIILQYAIKKGLRNNGAIDPDLWAFAVQLMQVTTSPRSKRFLSRVQELLNAS